MISTTQTIAGEEVTITRKTTRWHNPTGKTFKLEFFVSAGIGKKHAEDKNFSPAVYERFEIPANGEAQIPAIYDTAMHNVKGGVVVGGMCPLAYRDGQTYGVHPALIPRNDDKTMGIPVGDLAARLREAMLPESADPDAARAERARARKAGR